VFRSYNWKFNKRTYIPAKSDSLLGVGIVIYGAKWLQKHVIFDINLETFGRNKKFFFCTVAGFSLTH
jgi:type IV secretory pathway TraG/TraD family ATPase VirD4